MRSPATTKCGSMKRSCSSVPQRTSSCRYGCFQNRAIRARSSSCCVRLIRACGGISKARNSTSPSRPAARVGRIQLVDAELGPVRVAGHVDQQVAEHAIDQPGRAVCPLSGTCWKAISSSYRLSCRASSTRGAWLVGPTNSPKTDTTATDDCASRPPGCAAGRAGAGTGCRPASARRGRRDCRRRCRCAGRRA